MTAITRTLSIIGACLALIVIAAIVFFFVQRYRKGHYKPVSVNHQLQQRREYNIDMLMRRHLLAGSP